MPEGLTRPLQTRLAAPTIFVVIHKNTVAAEPCTQVLVKREVTPSTPRQTHPVTTRSQGRAGEVLGRQAFIKVAVTVMGVFEKFFIA